MIVGAAVAAGAFLFGETGLTAGNCFDPPADVRGAYAEFKAVPCTTPHGAEIYYASTFPGSDYDEPTMSDELGDRCRTEFNTYTGRDLDTDPDLDAGAWYPTEDEWAAGIHRVLCFAVRIDGEPLTGSVRAP